jgi:iron complex outermembrane receptor protein
MKRFKQKYLYVSLALSAFLTAGSAQAEIEEITVTANKREQSLQDVPMTVSVTSAETIKQSSIVDLIDLQTAVPSLRVNQLQSSAQTNFVIRGFGNGANNPGIEPAVLVLIDGVPRSRSSSSLADLPNLERVEVLSGPQSTLFGKNASTGVISITTKAPEGEMGGLVETTLGNYGTQIVKGTVTGPTGIENLSYRVSASTNESDGIATNLTDKSALNNRDRSAFRAQFQWDASDDLSARLIYDQDKIDEACCVTGPLFRGPASAVSDAIGGAALLPDATPWDRQVYMNFEPYNKVRNDGVSLHIEKDLGYATLTSITSDRNTDMKSNFDADFSSANLVKENKLDYNFDTFTQELRLTSNDDSEIQWTLGAFYSDEDTFNNRTVIFGDELGPYADTLIDALSDGDYNLDKISQAVAAGTLQGVYMTALGQTEAEAQQSIGANVQAYVGAQAQAQSRPPEDFTEEEMAQFQVDAIDATLTGFGQATSTQMRQGFFVPGGGSLGERFDMNAKTLSLFANVEFPIAEDWSASIGLNKTKDEKTVTADVEIVDLFASLPLAAVDPRLSAVQFFPPFTNYPNDSENGIFKSDDLTHTLRLTHDLSENTKAYVSHSTGFKPTSVNLSVNATDATKRAADPERSDNFEIGIKHSHDSGYINAAIFNQNIEGFQSNTFVGNGFQLVNAGDQRHKGIEIDMKQQLTEEWVMGLSAIKIDAEYESFVNGPCDHVAIDVPAPTEADPSATVSTLVFPTVACDVDEDGDSKGIKDRSGETPAGIHDWSANLNATYSFNVSDAVSSFLRLEYVYESEVDVVENVPGVTSALSGIYNAAAYGGNGVGNIPATRSTRNFNMSMGFNHAPSGIEVMLWGRNLTNHESLLSAFPTTAAPGSYGGYPTAPKTYGLTARATF